MFITATVARRASSLFRLRERAACSGAALGGTAPSHALSTARCTVPLAIKSANQSVSAALAVQRFHTSPRHNRTTHCSLLAFPMLMKYTSRGPQQPEMRSSPPPLQKYSQTRNLAPLLQVTRPARRPAPRRERLQACSTRRCNVKLVSPLMSVADAPSSTRATDPCTHLPALASK